MWADDGFYVTITLVGISWAFAWLGVRVSEARARRKAVEAGVTPELVDRLFEDEEEATSRYGSLKWGLVAVALGLGALAEAVFPYSWADTIAYGVVFVIGGVALIGYYVYMEAREEPDGSSGGGAGGGRTAAGDDAAGRGRSE